MLSAKDILAGGKFEVASVEIAELGGTVCVSTLSADEANRIASKPEAVSTGVFLMMLATCDESGARLFSDKDLPALGKLPSRAVAAVANKVIAHNGLGGDAQDEAKNVSGGTESDASASV